ncbi:hypothetical protein MB02_01105 [Croceicoccus estronivorus]|uniref:head completion/stabilization protein n=1 Tax=Croceicoccus estronivorus TaxID=1172626 RepID=UPI00082EA9B7|nr:head completion/stabilization protein [Croceicoccus estronivorus]OCC25302.1 hypothetical protein MB02_01105 [Croceicoccus estronivorus]
MTGFVSSPAAPATPPGAVLACGPFWPDIDLNHFRDSQRIGGTLIPDNRIRDALLGAVMTVETDLGPWRASQEGAGHASLAAVPGAQIGTERRLVLLWQRAVYGNATADLIETHRDVSATGQGQSASGDFDQRADDHRRNAMHAIRAILGKGRTAVELI